ncbi:MAG: hypothetical protein AAFN17_04385 [Pseudomonadota bacterium]
MNFNEQNELEVYPGVRLLSETELGAVGGAGLGSWFKKRARETWRQTKRLGNWVEDKVAGPVVVAAAIAIFGIGGSGGGSSDGDRGNTILV